MNISELIIEARSNKVADLAEALTISQVREIASRHNVKVRSKRELAKKLVAEFEKR